MTKEDYMRLPKERLAELLAERDAQQPVIGKFYQNNCMFDGGICINPFHHCDTCPRRQLYTYNTNTTSANE